MCEHEEGILKPEIVFFGESLGDTFSDLLRQDRRVADLVIVLGSSLQVCHSPSLRLRALMPAVYTLHYVHGWIAPSVTRSAPEMTLSTAIAYF